jgi:hypothetical protein
MEPSSGVLKTLAGKVRYSRDLRSFDAVVAKRFVPEGDFPWLFHRIRMAELSGCVRSVLTSMPIARGEGG